MLAEWFLTFINYFLRVWISNPLVIQVMDSVKQLLTFHRFASVTVQLVADY
jgi:hypothetical protein